MWPTIYKENNTIPTLAYMSGELKAAAENFLKEFNLLYESLEEGSYLSQEQENGLLLGTLFVGRNDDEWLLTPFHPLIFLTSYNYAGKRNLRMLQIL